MEAYGFVFIHTMEGKSMDMSVGTSSAFSNVNNRQNKSSYKQSAYASFFEDRVEQNAERKVRRPENAKGYSVTTYTDKDGNEHKVFTGNSTDVLEGLKKYQEKKKDDDKYKIKKHLQYSYQRVSNLVTMAKNSVSASKAVISATRSLADLKNKLKTAECSEDEKAAALAHATQMLRIAKKKKRNLEMEEMVKASLKEDGVGGPGTEFIKEDKEERRPFDISQLHEDGQGNPDGALLPEESLEMDPEMLADSTALENVESGIVDDLSMGLSDEMELEIEAMSEFTEEMNEEMNEILEDEMLDLMEVVNPHMDKEHFEELKLKHRLDEQKMLVKADTEYLKAYLKSIQGGGGMSVYNSSGSMNLPDASMFANMSIDVSAVAVSEVPGEGVGFSVSV